MGLLDAGIFLGGVAQGLQRTAQLTNQISEAQQRADFLELQKFKERQELIAGNRRRRLLAEGALESFDAAGVRNVSMLAGLPVGGAALGGLQRHGQQRQSLTDILGPDLNPEPVPSFLQPQEQSSQDRLLQILAAMGTG